MNRFKVALIFLLVSSMGLCAEKGTRRYYLNLCLAALAATPIAVLSFRSLQAFPRYKRVQVGGLSMLPTYDHEEEIVVDLKFGSIERGDVVVVDGSVDKSFQGFMDQLIENEGFENAILKRVVGLPGEEVKVFGHRIHINGKLLFEPYIRTTPPTPQERSLYKGSFGKQNAEAAKSARTLGRGAGGRVFVLGPNEYFLAGDNRPLSVDSRSFGPVRAKFVVGKVVENHR